jgi:hypothetical protein
MVGFGFLPLIDVTGLRRRVVARRVRLQPARRR